jgi:hypothetical protein
MKPPRPLRLPHLVMVGILRISRTTLSLSIYLTPCSTLTMMSITLYPLLHHHHHHSHHPVSPPNRTSPNPCISTHIFATSPLTRWIYFLTPTTAQNHRRISHQCPTHRASYMTIIFSARQRLLICLLANWRVSFPYLGPLKSSPFRF